MPGIAESAAGLGQPSPPAAPGTSPPPAAPALNEVSQTELPEPTSQEPQTVAVAETAPVEKGMDGRNCSDCREGEMFNFQ